MIRVAERRTPERYQRIEVAFTNRTGAPLTMRSCANDARLESYVERSEGMRAGDSARAFAIGAASNGGWSQGCREVRLAPGEPTALAYYVPGVGTGNGPRLLRIGTSVGEFVIPGQGVWSQSRRTGYQ